VINKTIRIKICGMTRHADIEHAVNIGADAIGLIFYSKSRRFISVDDAIKLVESIPAFVDIVAVFVNPTVDEVNNVITKLPVQFLQFHGEETPDFCEQFSLPYIKAIPAISTEDIMKASIDNQKARGILLDTPSSLHRGGSGLSFDWRIIPANLTKPIILAGGLDSLNINEAIATFRPFAVDVCTGVEISPGIKDHDKMSKFVEIIRSI